MGDRISIQFGNKDSLSVVLFSHWSGISLKTDAIKYVTELKRKLTGNITPLDRLEPNTVMIDFIRHLTKDMVIVSSDLYLGKTEYDGDNSNNGHHIIDL